MSSVVLWRDETTGVTVSWNKQAQHSVFVPRSVDERGIVDGDTTEWPSEKDALRAGLRAARARLEEMKREGSG